MDKGRQTQALISNSLGCSAGRKEQISGGGPQVGATSRWTVNPLSGEMGGEKRVQREIEAASTGERWRR